MEADQWRPFSLVVSIPALRQLFNMTTYRWWRNPRELWDGMGNELPVESLQIYKLLPNPLLALWKCTKLFPFLFKKIYKFLTEILNLISQRERHFWKHLLSTGRCLSWIAFIKEIYWRKKSFEEPIQLLKEKICRYWVTNRYIFQNASLDCKLELF